MSQPTYTSIDARILRLKVLVIEAREQPRQILTAQIVEDLDATLDELHRLHLAVATQRAELTKIVGEKRSRSR